MFRSVETAQRIHPGCKSLLLSFMGTQHSKATAGPEREVEVEVWVMVLTYTLLMLSNQICSEYTDPYRLFQSETVHACP